MALEESQSTARNLPMRTSSSSTLALVFYLWLTLARTPTEVSSSSALLRPTGLMESIVSSVMLPREWTLSRRLSLSEAKAVLPPQRSSLRTADSLHKLALRVNYNKCCNALTHVVGYLGKRQIVGCNPF